MASQNKHRRVLRSEIKKGIKSNYEEIGKIELKKLKKYLTELYSIDESVLDDLVFLKKGKDVWITNKATKNFLNFGKAFIINSLGLRAIRNAFGVPKITTNFAIFLNKNINSNYYELNKEELEEYTHGYDIMLKNDGKNSFKNYLIMKYNKEVYGVGLIIDNTIKSQVPKGRRLRNQINPE